MIGSTIFYGEYERWCQNDARAHNETLFEHMHLASPISSDGKLLVTSKKGMYRFVIQSHLQARHVSILSVIDEDVSLEIPEGHVLTNSKGESFHLPTSSANVSHMHILVEDDPSTYLYPYFKTATRFIYDELQRNDGRQHVIVHSKVGVSRSVTIVLAYLIKYENMSLTSALKHVQDVRYLINPNEGFMQQLERWEKECTTGST